MNKKRFILFMIFIMLFFTACTKEMNQEGEAPPEEVAEENLEPIEGGSFKLSVTRFNTINPLFNNEPSLKQVHQLIYEGLVAFDQELNIKPMLAQGWTISDDGQSIDFVLRKDVKWHDGEAFTAEDVIFTYQVIKGNMQQIKNTSIYQMSLQHISDMRAVGDGVVRVTFTRPFSNGLEVMTFPILPKHLFEGANRSKLADDSFPIIGTGPFQLAEHQRMKELKLTRNSQYWAKKPYIEAVEVVIVPDREAQISLFDNGDIDFAQPLSIDWARFADNKNSNVYEYVSNNLEFLGFNFKNQLLQDKNIRKAIAFGVDRHKIVKNIYLNHGTVTDVPINPHSWLYNQESLQHGYDIEKAQEILESQGYQRSSTTEWRTGEDNKPLHFKLITNSNNLLREKTAYFIQEELAALGIEIEVVLLEWEEFNKAIDKRDFDMILGGWELSHVPDLSFAFHSSQTDRTNFISYQDEKMDELLVKAFSAPSREEKYECYQELQQHIAEELPYFNILFQNGAVMAKDKIKGDLVPHHQNHFNNVSEWFINTK